MSQPTNVTITIDKNGPYLVCGPVPLTKVTIETDEKGDSIHWGDGKTLPASEEYALCRCGRSRSKPFCDGTHGRIGFDGDETASREPFIKQAEILDGPTMQLADAKSLCAFARFCDPNGQVWTQVEQSDNPEQRENLIRQAGLCPSGRLVAIEKATGKALEPVLSTSIGIMEDPTQECSGPLFVRGGIELIGADGTAYEVRNRMTLCRCGRSENKPFCDGAHASDPKFNDGL